MKYASSSRRPNNPFSDRGRSLTIWTARHGLSNVAAAHGMVVLDCRSVAGYPEIKPDPNFFVAFKTSGGTLDYMWLAKKYYEQLRNHYNVNKGLWLDLLYSKRLIVTCEDRAPNMVPDNIDVINDKVFFKMPNRYVVRTLLCELAIEHDIRLYHGGEVHWADNLKKSIKFVDWT